MIPRELRRDHVLRALDRIAREGIPIKRASHKHCLVHYGIHFAPKFVVSEACRAFRPDGLTPDEFSGGLETNELLRSHGFTIVKGVQPLRIVPRRPALPGKPHRHDLRPLGQVRAAAAGSGRRSLRSDPQGRHPGLPAGLGPAGGCGPEAAARRLAGGYRRSKV